MEPAPTPIADAPAVEGDPARRRLVGFAAGLAAATGLAVPATLVGDRLRVVGAPVVAVVAGMVVATVVHLPASWRPGLSFASKRLLQTSVVLLGLGLSLGEVATTGLRSLPVLVGTLVVALVTAALLGRRLGLTRDVTTLIGVGTAICGASAIAATDGVIEAEEADVGYAVAVIFIFNVVAVLLYPFVGHAFGFSQTTFGVWAGTAVNDLSSVVAATTVYGTHAAATGVVVKLTRTLAIVPIVLGLGFLRSRAGRATGAGPARRAVSLRRIVPGFIVAFMVAVLVNSAHLVPGALHRAGADAAGWLLTTALAAIGLAVDPAHLRRSGLRPLALGAILWATVALTSLGLQAATGGL